MGKRSSLWSVVIENCNSLWDISTSRPLVLVDLRKAHLFVQHNLEDPGGRNCRLWDQGTCGNYFSWGNVVCVAFGSGDFIGPLNLLICSCQNTNDFIHGKRWHFFCAVLTCLLPHICSIISLWLIHIQIHIQTWGVSSWPPEQTFLFVHIFRSQMLFWISVMEWWDLLSCFECRMKKKPRQIYRISLSLESTAQISVPFFFPSKQLKRVEAWLFKTSFTKKFAVLIYLWLYFDYVWYNDKIDLVLTSWGSRNRASPPMHKTFFPYIILYKNISLIRLFLFRLNLVRDWVILKGFLKGISAIKCNLPSHVLKWSIYWTFKRCVWSGVSLTYQCRLIFP